MCLLHLLPIRDRGKQGLNQKFWNSLERKFEALDLSYHYKGLNSSGFLLIAI